jgi:hypothetical protein
MFAHMWDRIRRTVQDMNYAASRIVEVQAHPGTSYSSNHS